MSETSQNPPVRRPARSKEGCLTCRRRKVRCNEQKPRCSHCERLNLECKWRPSSAARPVVNRGSSCGATRRTAAFQTPPQSTGSAPSIRLAPPAVDQLFDYASFMWSDEGVWQQTLSPGEGDRAISSSYPVSRDGHAAAFNWIQGIPIPGDSASTHPSDTSLQPVNSSAVPQPPDEQALMSYFINAVVPPILAQVETQQKWSSIRQSLLSMSNASPMVRSSILAFSDLLLRRINGQWLQSSRNYYDEAAAELALLGDASTVTSHSAHREYLLATLFFLSYIDILQGSIERAHANLKNAHSIFRQDLPKGFRSVEITLLSWIRLLDARAVSAGGEGLFLSDDEEELLVTPSPASLENDNDGHIDDFQETDIEAVLFEVLYQPGITFFQKIQSFMGRISKIDPWHRSRGTVEDETEVMNVGARISKDLRTLYESRPPLMDYAVAGKLAPPHVSEALALTITRAFRTYLSNYHASKVHLHRVAYKHLPLTRDTIDALNAIRHLARMMVDGSGEEESLPVNMLWPLLMLGAEENDPGERQWIRENILRMEKIATNARITAQILEEVQARQDATNSRVDIRSVMHAVFDSCFAIV